MNLPAYIDGLNRSVRNLPAIVSGWNEIDEELQSHYGNALLEQLLSISLARASAEQSNDRATLEKAWAHFRGAIVREAERLELVLGVNPIELLDLER